MDIIKPIVVQFDEQHKWAGCLGIVKEVKSWGYKRHTSLDAFCQKFSNRILQRYIIYTKDLQKDEQTLFLPVYLTQFL